MFKYKKNDIVIPSAPPFFGKKGQKQVMICQVKNRSEQKGKNTYTIHCFGDVGVRDLYEEELSFPIELFRG